MTGAGAALVPATKCEVKNTMGKKPQLYCFLLLDGCGALPREELGQKAEPGRLGSEHKRTLV